MGQGNCPASASTWAGFGPASAGRPILGCRRRRDKTPSLPAVGENPSFLLLSLLPELERTAKSGGAGSCPLAGARTRLRVSAPPSSGLAPTILPVISPLSSAWRRRRLSAVDFPGASATTGGGGWLPARVGDDGRWWRTSRTVSATIGGEVFRSFFFFNFWSFSSGLRDPLLFP